MTHCKKFELTTHSEHLCNVRTDLIPFLEKAGWDEKKSGEILVAVQEGLTNVMRHAYQGKDGKIELEVEDQPDRIHIRIRDFGIKFDPTKIPDPELPPTKPGGLGIFLMKKIMDEVVYDQKSGNANLLHLIKYKNSHQSKQNPAS